MLEILEVCGLYSSRFFFDLSLVSWCTFGGRFVFNNI